MAHWYALFSKVVMPLINSIATNPITLAIRNDINKSNSKISCALERMSSGFKINRAKDFILISFIIHIYFVYIIIIGKFIIKKVKRRCNIPAQLKLRTVNQDERRLYI